MLFFPDFINKLNFFWNNVRRNKTIKDVNEEKRSISLKFINLRVILNADATVDHKKVVINANIIPLSIFYKIH